MTTPLGRLETDMKHSNTAHTLIEQSHVLMNDGIAVYTVAWGESQYKDFLIELRCNTNLLFQYFL